MQGSGLRNDCAFINTGCKVRRRCQCPLLSPETMRRHPNLLSNWNISGLNKTMPFLGDLTPSLQRHPLPDPDPERQPPAHSLPRPNILSLPQASQRDVEFGIYTWNHQVGSWQNAAGSNVHWDAAAARWTITIYTLLPSVPDCYEDGRGALYWYNASLPGYVFICHPQNREAFLEEHARRSGRSDVSRQPNEHSIGLRRHTATASRDRTRLLATHLNRYIPRQRTERYKVLQ